MRSATCLREARELQADLHKRFVESDADLASLRLQACGEGRTRCPSPVAETGTRATL